jgi:hypothetical protein
MRRYLLFISDRPGQDYFQGSTNPTDGLAASAY